MKKVTISVVIVAMVLFFAGVVFAVDPFAGLQVTPPDQSVSPDIRALFGKSGKWGKKADGMVPGMLIFLSVAQLLPGRPMNQEFWQ